jgi:hypothetical protein
VFFFALQPVRCLAVGCLGLEECQTDPSGTEHCCTARPMPRADGFGEATSASLPLSAASGSLLPGASARGSALLLPAASAEQEQLGRPGGAASTPGNTRRSAEGGLQGCLLKCRQRRCQRMLDCLGLELWPCMSVSRWLRRAQLTSCGFPHYRAISTSSRRL